MEACPVKDGRDGKVALEFSALAFHKKCSATNPGLLAVGGALADLFDRVS
jgi:hypothetical protein